MELYNGQPYWQTTVKTLRLPRQTAATHYDALIVGTGMSGSLCALTLANAGLHLAMIDERQVGAGSTSANTGLLQYSNDMMLSKLMSQIGEKAAVRFYRLCLEAVNELEQVAHSLATPSDFIRRDSLYYASTLLHIPRLKKEFNVLKTHGFPVRYLNQAQIESEYGFSKHGAIVTAGDAEVNPLKFSRSIIRTLLEQQRTDIFERTALLEVQDRGNTLVAQTSAGEIRASAIILATGYEKTPLLRKKRAAINRSYAIATKPIEQLSRYWKERALIWETRRPYLYLRTTVDNRIIAGGFDQEKSEAPAADEISKQASRLKKELDTLFPMLPIEIDYAWGALFGESTDNLPYIGRHPRQKNIYYLLGYGGNGTVYSMLGSLILRDLLTKGYSSNADLVRLDR
ncbi:MAG: NAD(P)/FAD-dependent oxidoreductase [Sporolactobacillus sp.]